MQAIVFCYSLNILFIQHLLLKIIFFTKLYNVYIIFLFIVKQVVNKLCIQFVFSVNSTHRQDGYG